MEIVSINILYLLVKMELLIQMLLMPEIIRQSEGELENFGGYIDDFYVYNKALDAKAVAAIGKPSVKPEKPGEEQKPPVTPEKPDDQKTPTVSENPSDQKIPNEEDKKDTNNKDKKKTKVTVRKKVTVGNGKSKEVYKKYKKIFTKKITKNSKKIVVEKL